MRKSCILTSDFKTILRIVKVRVIVTSLIFIRYLLGIYSIFILLNITTYGRSHWFENATRTVTMETTQMIWQDSEKGSKGRKNKGKEERRNESEKVQKRRTEGRNKAQREAIPTAIVRKPCKDCGPISAPPCVREFISSPLPASSFVGLLPRFLQ